MEDPVAANLSRVQDELASIRERLTALETPPRCVYEARERSAAPTRHYHQVGNTELAAWCCTHGWDCPNTVALSKSKEQTP